MITTLAENTKPFIPGLELISCPLQLIPFPDMMKGTCHIIKVLTASSEALVTVVTSTSQ